MIVIIGLSIKSHPTARSLVSHLCQPQPIQVRPPDGAAVTHLSDDPHEHESADPVDGLSNGRLGFAGDFFSKELWS